MAVAYPDNDDQLVEPRVEGEERVEWYALLVRSRREKSVASQLADSGLRSFLPTYPALRQWSDRKKETYLAMFPGYVFCQFALRNRLQILKTPSVMQIVGIGRQPQPVSEDEIHALKTAVASGIPREPVPFLEVGRRVRLTRGPLSGFEGILLDLRGSNRIVISISLLRRSVSLEIDRSWICPLHAASAGHCAVPALAAAVG